MKGNLPVIIALLIHVLAIISINIFYPGNFKTISGIYEYKIFAPLVVVEHSEINDFNVFINNSYDFFLNNTPQHKYYAFEITLSLYLIGLIIAVSMIIKKNYSRYFFYIYLLIPVIDILLVVMSLIIDRQNNIWIVPA